jgi:hypothetical protein
LTKSLYLLLIPTSPSSQSLISTILFFHSTDLTVHFMSNGIMQHLSFCDWLILLSITSWKFTHAIVYQKFLFFFKVWVEFHFMHVLYFLYTSSTHEQGDCFSILATDYSGAMRKVVLQALQLLISAFSKSTPQTRLLNPVWIVFLFVGGSFLRGIFLRNLCCFP